MVEEAIYTRARPESVRLTEMYYYDREISRNPSTRTGQAPTGRIEVVVPYDGYQYFTRQACQDVEHQVDIDTSQERVDALIGHLALSNYGRTDLNDILELSDRYGSVPLRVPVVGDGITNRDQLRDDQHACVIAFNYSPRWPDVTPIGIEMALLDEEILSLPSVELSTEDRREQLGNVVAQIAQQVSFRRNLLLITRVTLDLPRRLAPDGLNPKVMRMSLGWPTITSFRALHLFIGDITPDKEIPVTYNPLTCSLEWVDVPMEATEKSAGTDLQTYFSKPMYLLIDQPGELYQEKSLDGQVEVEIPGRLLSGLQVRLYNEVGMPLHDLKPEVTTRVIANVRLIHDDAFIRRTLSPYQHLHFDEVIPDEMRIADIRTALADRGFRIPQDLDITLLRSPDELKHFILAERPEGPDTMELWVFVEGKRYTTERQTQVPGGQMYTSTFESGELKVYMRGELPGNSRGLIREMNAFQTALRDRFERLRAKR